MPKIVQYTHHGVSVHAFKKMIQRHQEHCLCWQSCSYFKPGTAENCQIAQAVYSLDVEHSLVTPVFECPKYA